jgi:nucleotide-binding universal stress UspA family protein
VDVEAAFWRWVVLSDDEQRALAELERHLVDRAPEPVRRGRPGRVDDGPVVVAVGNDSSGEALDWAAAEASARGCRLHVVHAERPGWVVDPSGLVLMADFPSCRAAAVQGLRAAMRRARALAPDVDISTELLVGPTVPSLVVRSRGAQLLVLGSGRTHFRSRFLTRLAPPLAGRVAGRARCPVVTVGPLPSDRRPGSSPRVVVGVGRHDSCTPALGMAFRAAAQRGVPLTVVHAWMSDLPADHEGVCDPVAASRARADAFLRQTLEPWRDQFVDVSVVPRLVIGDPADVVIRESQGAALVVVGSGVRGVVGGRLFGSVSRSVTQQAGCPVVVVRTGPAAVDERAEPDQRTAVAGVDPPGSELAERWREPWE